MQVSRKDYALARQSIEESRADRTSAYGTFLSIFHTDVPAVEVEMAEAKVELAVDLAADMILKIRKFDYGMYLPEALLLQSRVFQSLGQADAVENNLNEARKVAEASESLWALWQIYAALAQLYTGQRGDEYQERARKVIQQIANNVGAEQGLKESLLSLPQVQRVLGGAKAKTS